MKIGIEGQRLFRQKKHGMDFVALELVKNIQLEDQENEYFIFVKPGPDKCLHSSANVHIIELPGKSYPWWEQIALPRAVKKYGCEILHCTSNTGPVICPVPLIVTVHDIFYLEVVSLFKKGFSAYQKFGNMYRRYVVPIVVKHSRKIITVSLSEKKRIASFFKIYDNRLTVVYNGVSDIFQPVTDPHELQRVREVYKLPGRFIFLLGNTDPKKNTRGVILAYATYRAKCKTDIPLLIADFPENTLNAILTENNCTGIRSDILRLDYIKNTDLPAIYSMSDQFLYPSFWESFGIPILEAMSCGTPVITSNVFSMPEIAGDAALLVDPNNPDEIAQAIIRLSSEPGLKNQLISKGIVQAKKFSWNKMALDVMKLYREILTSPGQPTDYHRDD